METPKLPLNATETQLMAEILQELAGEIVALNPQGKSKILRKEKFHQQVKFPQPVGEMKVQDIRLGYNIKPDGTIEFGIRAILACSPEQRDAFVHCLMKKQGDDEDFQIEVTQSMIVYFKRWVNVDDQDFERTLKSVKEQILDRIRCCVKL